MSQLANLDHRAAEAGQARSRLIVEAGRVVDAVAEVRALNRPDVWRGRVSRSSRDELDTLLRRLRVWVDEIRSLGG